MTKPQIVYVVDFTNGLLNRTYVYASSENAKTKFDEFVEPFKKQDVEQEILLDDSSHFYGTTDDWDTYLEVRLMELPVNE